MWEGGKMKKVNNGDIGGGGLKLGIFAVTSFLNGPYVYYVHHPASTNT